MEVNGVARAAFNRVAWHNKGVVKGTLMSIKEAIELSKLDDYVYKEQLQCPDGTLVEAYANRLTSTKNVLGVVGSGYKVIQNIDAFNTLESIVGSGMVKINSAFALGKGEKICVSCEIPETFGSPEDPLKGYLVITNSHDGKNSAAWVATLVRVVCQNTLNMAFGGFEDGEEDQSGERKIKVRHSGDMPAKLVNVEEFMKNVLYGLRWEEKKLNSLKNVPFTDDEFKMMMLKISPPPDTAKNMNDVPTKTANIWASMFYYWKHGCGMDIKGSKDTAYGAINALTEYADWGKGVRKTDGKDEFSARTEAVLWGASKQMKEKGVEVLQELLSKKGSFNSETVRTFTQEVEKASEILQKKNIDDDNFITNLSNLVNI